MTAGGSSFTSRSMTPPGWRQSKCSTTNDLSPRSVSFVAPFPHFASCGITVERLITDNGNPDSSTVHAIACRTLHIRHIRTRPYRPETNGKAERFIRTLLGGWAYGAIYRDSSERNAALAGWLDF
jgi:hypothetical protein